MESELLYLELAFNIPLRQTFTYSCPKNEEPAVGMRAEAQLKNRKITGWIISISSKGPTDYKVKSINRLVDEKSLFREDTLELSRWLSGFYLCSLGEALSVILPGGRKEKEIPPFESGLKANTPEVINLTDQQNQAINRIREKMEGLWYLHGITGSGKTEVYLALADEMIKQRKGIIYLVPEISLTHQMIEPIKKRYGDKLAIVHSHLTGSQRLNQWNRILSGEATFVLGARSAVFAPVKNLGMIVLDEEHESSYKAGSTPRYHARQVAMYRIKQNSGLLIMGSATPSLESYHFMEKGILEKIVMDKRAAGGTLPQVKLVDMSKEQGIISQELIREINKSLDRGKQVILFLNRRGFSYHFHCKSCNYEMTCHQCSVPLTLHKEKNAMICHYCGFQSSIPRSCPHCRSMDVGYSGFGTEQIEDQMDKLFPQVDMVRLDRDTAAKRGETKRILKEFQQGKYQILLGTQMVAKGLNFPKVNLVGIVLADTTLNLPDFRSPERTFNLVTQVAGRAGRYSDDGKVILQTFRPESPTLQMAMKQDLKGFYEMELANRNMLGFPPASRMIRLVFRSKIEKVAMEEAEKAENILSQWGGDDIMGPAECPLGKISGNFRYQLLLRASEITKIHHLVRHYLDVVDFPSSLYVEVDMDPQNLL